MYAPPSDRAGLGPVAHMAVDDYQNFADGLAAFMALQPNSTAIRYGLFGVAGVVEDGRCALTNNAWVVDTAQLRARFGFAGSHIVNDFEAVAWSLPLLAASDLGMIGGGPPKQGAPMVVVGPGTGLALPPTFEARAAVPWRAAKGGHTSLPSA